ncbi:MAG: tRNA (cytidine(56)-2'-O)-methyltransferase [Candidatus Methanomethyliaceae archaeon]|nr:tRNA (cytidine(56)-2'-O)-methyltransferase [Candidatus Methanomethyliaceae archaeon]MDW7970253.1 tRNA methyltransferase [Nitrososphaerota archaeon]
MRDERILKTISKICEIWGGDFWIEFIESPLALMRNWKKRGAIIVHLTMYGIPINQALRNINLEKDVLIIVGGEKVPIEYYYESDYNIAIGNQPHSEVAALAIFLDRITNGTWEYLKFQNAKLVIIPSEKGKKVLQING